MENNHTVLFFDKLYRFVNDKTLIRLVLSSQRDRASDLKSVIVTIIELKKGARLNFVYRYKTKDVAKNYEVAEALSLVKKSMEDDFFNADLFSGGETLRLLISGQGKAKIRSGMPSLKAAASFSHDRTKERVIATQNNIYLKELGILNANYEVRHEMNDKFLQINRYIELMAPFIRELGSPEVLHVADMGSGKGYLTFALYDYLVNILGKPVKMTGVESREELVILCSEIAKKAAFTNLEFTCGAISEVKLDNPDILIALHACDTATDDAIFRGISSGASLIVCAPCCHKQVRKEFKATNAMKGILKHGILEERQAEIITDGIRALMLEAHGYKTKVFEFISTEHTPKNVMIVGRKIKGKPSGMERSLETIRAIREMFGVERHYLEGLFVSRDA